MDTHNPHGFRSRYCSAQGARDFEGIVGCSARQIAGFIEAARRRGFLEDTAVVVVGDHLAFPNPAWDKLERAGERRRMFNLFVSDTLPPPNTNELLPFDVFPSLLELAGLEVAGDRLGLGYSAFGATHVRRPIDRRQSWSLAAVRGSTAYDRLWQADVPPAP